jgi:hypothetical protein
MHCLLAMHRILFTSPKLNDCVHLPGRSKERGVSKNRHAARSRATLGSLQLSARELFDVACLANCLDCQSDTANYDKITMKVARFKANLSFYNAGQRDHSAELRASRNAAVVKSTW